MANPPTSTPDDDHSTSSPVDPALREDRPDDASPPEAHDRPAYGGQWQQPPYPADGPGISHSAYRLRSVSDASGEDLGPRGVPPHHGPPFEGMHPWGYGPPPGPYGPIPGGPNSVQYYPPHPDYRPQLPPYLPHGPPPPPFLGPPGHDSTGTQSDNDRGTESSDAYGEPKKKKKKKSRTTPAEPGTAGGARKANIACSYCRKRKIKCDELKPICSSCDRLGQECIYDNERRFRGKAKGPSERKSTKSGQSTRNRAAKGRNDDSARREGSGPMDLLPPPGYGVHGPAGGGPALMTWEGPSVGARANNR